MDPQQRLMLEVVYEALEIAGLPPSGLSGTDTGVFVGQFTDDYKDMVSRDSDTAMPFSVTGLQRTSTSNRISWLLDLKGPSVTVDTACSSSLIALHLACQSLQSGECNTAIVGGCNLMINPEMFVYLSGQGFLAPDGKCKSFDASANGYGRGEGFAALVLRRVDEALAAEDPIRAVIRATGSGQDGHTKGFTLPSSDAQAKLIRDVYSRAGLDFSETSYVEAHGTGTKAGDLEETTALSVTIAANRPFGSELIVGSVKPNVGHLEAVAGIAGVIKGVLALEHGVIPPNINLDKLNPNISFDEWRLKVPRSLTPWPASSSGVRRVSCNSFGYGGSNAHAIIDDAPSYLSSRGLNGVHVTKIPQLSDGSRIPKSEVDASAAIHRLFPFSAQDKEGIGRVRKALASYLEDKPAALTSDSFLADLAYTLSYRRERLQWKSFATASTVPELLQALQDDATQPPQYLSSRRPALGLIFTGQGAQWPAMGVELMQIPVFKASIEAADAYLRAELDCEWSAAAELAKGKSTSKVAAALYGQTLCTVLQVALVDLLRTWDVVASSVVGHSSGEIAAAYCLGALSREDAWKIAYYRGLLSASLRENGVEGAMMAVGASPEAAAEAIAEAAAGEVHIACVNSPQSVTVSGEVDGVNRLLEALQSEGVFARKLKVDTAYHSPHMQEVAEDYYEAIGDIQPRVEAIDKGCRMFSSVTGAVIRDASELGPAYWVRNLVSPVQFASAVQHLAQSKDALDNTVDLLVEIGPHAALQGPATQSLKAVGVTEIPYHSILTRFSNAFDTALALAGTLYARSYPVNFGNINQASLGSRKPQILVDLPTYPWNHSNRYWAESRLAREYRLREPSSSGLLGNPHPSLTAQERVWRGFIKFADTPWVEDHRIQGTALYPAAGFIAMAVEAALAIHTDPTQKVKMFRLREVNLIAALVVPSDSSGVEYTVLLRPNRSALREASGAWTEFTVSSSPDGKGMERICVGLITLEFEPTASSPLPIESSRHNASMAAYQQALKSCKTKVKPEAFYRELDGVGLNYGPAFRLVTEIQVGPGQSCGEVEISAVGIKGKHQRPHIIHPGTLDAVFHLVFAALKGTYGYITQAMVPKTIDEIAISAKIAYEAGAHLKGFSKAARHGFNEVVGDIVMTDQNGAPVLKIAGFCCSEVGGQSQSVAATKSICSRLVWRPAVTFLDGLQGQKSVIDRAVQNEASEPRSLSRGGDLHGKATRILCELIKLVHHSKPDLSIVEVVSTAANAEVSQPTVFSSITAIPAVLETAECEIWCQDELSQQAIQANLDQAEADSTVKVEVRDLRHAQFTDIGTVDEAKRDVIIIPSTIFASATAEEVGVLIRNAKALLASDGRLCLTISAGKARDIEAMGRAAGLADWAAFIDPEDQGSGEEKLTVLIGCSASTVISAPLVTNGSESKNRSEEIIFIIVPAAASDTVVQVAAQLRDLLSTTYAPAIIEWSSGKEESLSQIKAKDCISLLELEQGMLPNLSEADFASLKHLVLESRKLLWVSGTAHEDPGSSLVNGLARVVRNEEPGLAFHTLSTPKLCPDGPIAADRLSELIRQVFQCDGDSGETEFSIQDGVICTSRVIEDHILNTQLHRLEPRNNRTTTMVPLDKAGPLKLSVQNAGLLDSLCYEPDDRADTPLADDEVEITVKAVSLNFRDVMTVMGQMPGLDLGWDAAGIVRRTGSCVAADKSKGGVQVGDRVVMLNPGALRTVHRAKASYCAVLDNGLNLSFEEAASIPLVHGTAWYALIHIARVRQGQSILIHAAAGGVGQSAIQIAKHTGMEVFATVGSDAKRALLRDTYGIPDDHIFSSRDTNFSFVQGIKQRTKGRGVDVILNSLSGEALRQTWYCIAPFGTFIEIGAKDIINNARLDMRPLLQGASFHFFDIKRIALEKPDIMAEIVKGTFELQRKGVTRPIMPLVTYPAREVEAAFRLMQSGRHQGKIALSFGGEAEKELVPVWSRHQGLGSGSLNLDPEAAYVLAGGLGGLGRSLATLLVDNGARKLCVLTRSGNTSVEAQQAVSDWERRGVKVTTPICDVTNADAVEKALKECGETLGRIKGVIQCAMVLRDGLFRNMTHMDWTESTQPKVQGTWNLHQALQGENGEDDHVDFFVVLSSFTAIYGERGVANYAAGGAYQDAVAHFRRARGLHAVTLDVGIMRDIGVLSQRGMTDGFRDWQEPYGLLEEELLRLAKMAIAGDMAGTIAPQVLTGLATGGSAIAAGIDSPWYLDDARFSIMAKTGVRARLEGETKGGSIQSRLASVGSVAAGAAVVLEALVHLVAKMLNTTPGEIDTFRFLHSYGIDSLTAIELINWALKECKARITVFDIMAAVPITVTAEKIAANSSLLSKS
ncbi:unnamed protein product [Discula destructiva]